MRRPSLVLALLLALAPGASAAAPPAPAPLHVGVFAQTDLPLGQVTWTGREWLYVAESLGTIEAADADGTGVRPFASLDQGGEEMRCAVPPNRLWPDGVYCHTPDNRIVRLDRDGANLVTVAELPPGASSDGALAFDDVGRFGYPLLVATGGSGSDGGVVYAVRKTGRVQRIGSYPGPGGADELAVAPAGFGSVGGWCLITVDDDPNGGMLVAVDPKGRLRTIVPAVGNSANPLVVVRPAPASRPAGGPAPGLYLADTTSRAVWFSPVAGFRGLTGAVIVGTEVDSKLLAVVPGARGGFDVVALATDLPERGWNFEGSFYVG